MTAIGDAAAAVVVEKGTPEEVVDDEKEKGSSSSESESNPSVVVGTRTTRPRRTYGALLASLACAAPVLFLAGDAMAAGWYNDVGVGGGGGGGGGAFVGGGGGGFGVGAGDPSAAADDLYDYGTKDLAVDLASPLVAYKVVSWALNQEVPVWLDAIILLFVVRNRSGQWL